MNLVVIFAGGVGRRMNAKDKPKQFLMVHGKPIIVHTIEIFQEHSEIDGIIISCVEDWIPYMEEMRYRYRLDKISRIVAGGKTGQMSIYRGLQAAAEEYGRKDHIVLVHDGVRPLIDGETISRNIACVKQFGSAITCAKVKETVILADEDACVDQVVNRTKSWLAKAPQSFFLDELLENQERAIGEGNCDMIDCCTLMHYYGKQLHLIEGGYENIKITTPDDFFTFRALYDARENEQLI